MAQRPGERDGMADVRVDDEPAVVGAEALEDEDRRHKVARLHRAHRQNLLAVGNEIKVNQAITFA